MKKTKYESRRSFHARRALSGLVGDGPAFFSMMKKWKFYSRHTDLRFSERLKLELLH